MSRKQKVTPAGDPPSDDSPALALFGARPCFRLDDFAAAYVASGHSASAAREVVHHHSRSGRIVNVQRGVYRYTPASFDPYALGAQLTPDAVIAYGSAVRFHHMLKGYPASTRISVMTTRRIRELEHEGHTYFSVAARAIGDGVAGYRGVHQLVRVTTPARTIADIIDRPDLGPGLERVFQVMLETDVNPWQLAQAAVDLGHAQTVMRLGYLLMHHPHYREVPRLQGDLERGYRPKQPFYWDAATRDAKETRLIDRWNVIVPLPLDNALSTVLDEWRQ